jgi:sugar phosphate isomerase/epimerase
MKTATGSFPIGFRRGWSDWQKDLGALTGWARENGFEVLDLGVASREDVETVTAAGLRLGSADLKGAGLMSVDAGRRREAVDTAVAYVKEAATFGVKVFFTVVIPENAAGSRAENYAIAVESFGPVCAAAADAGAIVAIEGWPGSAPHYPSLCCTPETVRRLIADLGGKGVGINYDPSHLIRLGVNHLQFLREFVGSVAHVHGKDTQVYPDALYEYGFFQDAAFSKPHGFGSYFWRYTIPGNGNAIWPEIFSILTENKYQGCVSIELEDENFNGTEAGEKDALLKSMEFLSKS